MENILRHWPSLAAFAADLKVPYQTAAAWKRRGGVPGRYDIRLIDAAAARGVTITLDELARMRAGLVVGVAE